MPRGERDQSLLLGKTIPHALGGFDSAGEAGVLGRQDRREALKPPGLPAKLSLHGEKDGRSSLLRSPPDA